MPGVTVPRMNDVEVLVVTASVPQSANFGIKGDVAASFLRVNGVEPKTSADTASLPPAADRGGPEDIHGAGDVYARKLGALAGTLFAPLSNVVITACVAPRLFRGWHRRVAISLNCC